jgi:Domain of unknown function (DUF4381)
MSFFLAAIQTATATPPGAALRDIQPPVEPPYSLATILAASAVALLVLGLAVWRFVRWLKHRPVPPPPSPRAIALRELERLRAQVRELDPYQFSIAVSDVLRHFIGAHFGLHAEKQTSPEFLDSIRLSYSFSEEDRRLLAHFLERCDLVKFARIQADETTSEALLGSAFAFVQGACT